MTAVVPDPDSIRAFPSAQAFEKWLARHHDKASELYLRIYKKDSGVATVTNPEAVEIALCWGWIDGLRKPLDALSFLQRFTPRKAKSRWSQINCERVEQLTKAGRMTPHGQRHVDAAKADGRWTEAYAGSRAMTIPDDLRAAIDAEPKARALFEALNRANLYALAYRVHHTKTPEARSRKIATLVEMLKRGETIHPLGKPRAATKAVAKEKAMPKKPAKKSG
jgi:uncharacterized protein YdeI (YjbR/CyaY-like superfamily)